MQTVVIVAIVFTTICVIAVCITVATIADNRTFVDKWAQYRIAKLETKARIKIEAQKNKAHAKWPTYGEE